MQSAGRDGLRAVVLATAVLAFAGLAVGQQFRYNTIWVPGSTSTVVYWINDFGTPVGYYETMPGGYFNGFMMTGKTATTIDYPGAYNTICYGINNSGEVVGQYVDTEGFYHVFEYENGTYTIMDPPGATYAGAGAINNLGEIAGVYTDAEGSHGFILSGTTYQTLNVPGAAYTLWGGGINDSGDVTLQWSSGTDAGSSIYNGSTYTTIQIDGAEDILAYGINNSGDIAVVRQNVNTGFTQTSLGLQNSRGGYTYLSLEDPLQTEGDSTLAFGVNNNTVVVGYYIGTFGDYRPDRGFAATPVRLRRWRGRLAPPPAPSRWSPRRRAFERCAFPRDSVAQL